MPIRSVSFSFSFDRVGFFYSFAFPIHSPDVPACLVVCVVCMLYTHAMSDRLTWSRTHKQRSQRKRERECESVDMESEWEQTTHIFKHAQTHNNGGNGHKAISRIRNPSLSKHTCSTATSSHTSFTYIFIYVCSIIFIRDLNWIQLNDGMVEMYAMTAAASECLNARIDTRVCATLKRQPCANAAVQSPLIQHFDGFPWLAAIHIECDELPNACMVCV